MAKISYGCQTYPWKMNMEKFAGDVPHMAQVAAEAGFAGLEAEICMLGEYFDRPEEVREILDKNGLELAAVVLHQKWEQEKETDEEEALTKKTIEFVRHFPWAKIMVSHHAGAQPRGEGEALKKRRENLLSCMDSVAVRAAEAGIVTCYHPNSAKNSLFRNAEDYQVLFDMLEKTSVGICAGYRAYRKRRHGPVCNSQSVAQAPTARAFQRPRSGRNLGCDGRGDYRLSGNCELLKRNGICGLDYGGG